MNEILKQVDTQSLKLFPIEAPSLDKPDYGKNIKEQFENIDDNFKLIANRDFVKGDPGNSLYIENIILNTSDDGIGGELYSALEQAITKQFNSEGALNSVNGYNWNDSITSGGLNVPIIVSQNETKGEPEYICAASPVMLFDNRFNDKAINGEDFSSYEDVVDVTSILNFKKNGNNWLCELNLSYPRLQYSNGSFRWVINNTNTVVKSTGIKGDPGESANIWIVRTQEFSEEFDGTTINIADYFMDGEWTHLTPEGIKTGDLAIVYCESEDKEYYGFFISQIKVENNNNMIVYDHNGNIQNINYVKNTTEFFKSLGDSNAAKGMFLKFQPGDSSTQSHMLYNEGENLYIKPVNNYDNVTETYSGNPSSINIVGYNELNVEGRTTLNSDLTVTNGKIDMNGATLTRQNNNSLEISGGGVEILGGGLTVERFTSLDDGLSVSNSLTVLGGPTILNGDLTVTNGKIDMNGATLTRQNDNSLEISGGGVEILGGGLTVEGFTSLNAGLKVYGGITTIGSREGLTLKSNDSDVYNSAAITLNKDNLNISADSDVIIGPGLKVWGTYEGERKDVLEVGAVDGVIIEKPTQGAKFNVKCPAVFEDTLDVTGTTTLNDLKVTGTTELTGLDISNIITDYIYTNNNIVYQDINVGRHIKISTLGSWLTPAKTITMDEKDDKTHFQSINYNDILTNSGYGIIKLNGNGLNNDGEEYGLTITGVPEYSLLHFGISVYNADTNNEWNNMNIYIGSYSSGNQIHDFDVPKGSTIKKEFFVLTGEGGKPLWHNGNIDKYKSYYT